MEQPTTYTVVNVAKGKTARTSEGSVKLDGVLEVSIAPTHGLPFLVLDLEQTYRLENVVLDNSGIGSPYHTSTIIVETSTDQNRWYIAHSGRICWSGTYTVPLSGMISAKYIRLRSTEERPLSLKSIQVNARSYKRFGGPAFVARRADGLGERLNAILNAIWLSELFDTPFKFYWPLNLLGDPQHAIARVEDMFSDDFIAAHHIPVAESRGLKEIPPGPSERNEIEWRLALDGAISAPRTHLSKHLLGIPETQLPSGLKRAFARIGFSADIQAAVNLARSTPAPTSSVALHLRSGDIFFGEYRKYLHYTYKGITTPVAKAIIEKYNKKGVTVFLFGQDADQLEYLSNTCSAVNSLQLNKAALGSMSPHQKAMYDLVLLSRFRTIVAGTSGFAKQAAWVGGSNIVAPEKVLTANEQYAASVEDLRQNGSTYHPLQTGFAYWYAYFYGRKSREQEKNIEALKAATSFDPDNELYFFVLSAILQQVGDTRGAAQTLEDMFSARERSGMLSEVFRVFTSKTDGEYNVKEYIPHIEEAAKQGSFLHAALMFYLSRHKGNSEGEIFYRTLAERNTTSEPELKNAVEQFLFSTVNPI